MKAVGTMATIDRPSLRSPRRHARAIDAAALSPEDRLPLVLAMPLIGGLSLGLWVGIWQLGRLALGG